MHAMLTRRMGFLLALCLLFVAASLHADWKKVRPEIAKCSVLMPDNPTYQTSIKKTANGQITCHEWLLESGNVAYLLMFNDYNDDPKSPMPAEKMIAAVAGGYGDGATERVESDVIISGHPGKEVVFVQGKERCIARTCYVAPRLYQAIAVAPTNESFDGCKKFVESLEVPPAAPAGP